VGGFVAFWLAEVSLVLQVSVLSLLLVSLGLKFGGRHFWHGVLMLSALALHTASIFVVMVPSLMVLGQPIASFPLDRLSIVVIFHVAFGVVAEILAVWLVGAWRLQSDVGLCVRRKRWMRVTFSFWVAALALGVLLYVLLYTTLIA
jgi:uncharacterized membrane protein YozB (DUF420 family)